jgi:hypothetical protein
MMMVFLNWMGTNMVVHNGPGMHVSKNFLIRAYKLKTG